VNPGFSWGPGDSSTPCTTGFFNPGYNTRRCTMCPGGLITLQPGATSATDCTSPPGYYYQRGKALPCPRGTYKESSGTNANCDTCPEGITTPGGQVAMSNRTACKCERLQTHGPQHRLLHFQDASIAAAPAFFSSSPRGRDLRGCVQSLD
jgi:hypothetical protein